MESPSRCVREIPNLAAHVFQALKGLEVRLVAQGASHWSVSFVVKENDVPEAARRLHEEVLEVREDLALMAG